MANTRSSGGSRSRDAFRLEFNSLLADLGELTGEPEAPPAGAPPEGPPGAGTEADSIAPSQPPEAETHGDVPAAVEEERPAEIVEPAPERAEAQVEAAAEMTFAITETRVTPATEAPAVVPPFRAPVPDRQGAEWPWATEEPPASTTETPAAPATPDPSAWPPTPVSSAEPPPAPPAAPAPPESDQIPSARDQYGAPAPPESDLAPSALDQYEAPAPPESDVAPSALDQDTVPAPPPPSAPGASDTVELEDLPSFSPSYLPPLPPIVPMATPQPERWGSPIDDEPPPPPPDWPLMGRQPSFEELGVTDPEETTVPAVWPSVPVEGGSEPPSSGLPPASHHHPVALPTAWPTWSELAEPADAAAADQREAAATPAGDEQLDAFELLPSVPHAVPLEAAEPADAQPNPGPGDGQGWPQADPPPPAPAPAPPVLPGWSLRPPPRPAAGYRSSVPSADAERAWEVRASPTIGLTPAGEPLADNADPWPPEAQSPPFAAEPAPEEEAGPEMPEPPLPAPIDVPRPPDTNAPHSGGASLSLSAAATATSGAVERPAPPLIPGGLPAQVSTRPWSLAAAMEPLAPLAPPPPRATGASPAEPVGTGIVLEPPVAGNTPFPVIVTILIAILLVIVVLLAVRFHG